MHTKKQINKPFLSAVINIQFESFQSSALHPESFQSNY